MTTLFLVVMLGLGILVGLVAVILGNDVRPEMVAVIASVYLAAVFGICFMLARRVPKLIDAKLKAIFEPEGHLAPRQLEPVTTAQLAEFREPVSSVTDRTTRTLEETPLKRAPRY